MDQSWNLTFKLLAQLIFFKVTEEKGKPFP